MKGETWMHTETPHNPDPSIEERCAFYKWELDQLEAGLPGLKIAEATGSMLSQIDPTRQGSVRGVAMTSVNGSCRNDR